jgi:hypothetical protein
MNSDGCLVIHPTLSATRSAVRELTGHTYSIRWFAAFPEAGQYNPGEAEVVGHVTELARGQLPQEAARISDLII